MVSGLHRALGVCLLLTLLPHACAEEEESNADLADSLESSAQADDAKAVLKKTVNETAKMRHTVSRVLHKSVEEVKTLKSLLITNAKGAAALNELYTEMAQLTKRMATYEDGMESCQKEMQNIKLQSEEVLSPAEANDPLIGSASLMQLSHHAETLHRQVKEAIQLHSKAQQDPTVGAGPVRR